MQADEVSYDKDNDVVTATGRVEIQRAGQILLADKVVYNRTTDTATATGHVSLIEPNGTVAYVEKIDVSGDLKEALAGEIRVMMADKSRMTGRIFRRTNEHTDEIYQGAYTACDICDDKSPLWRIQADRVVRDIDAQMVYYHDLWLDIKGVPVFYTPYLSTPDPTAGRKSGLLNPEFGGGSILGALIFAQPYYINIAPDRDATITPFFSSNAGKGATLEYRQDFKEGRFDFFGTGVDDENPTSPHDFRGNIRSMARWDIDDNWRSGADVNLASDQTYLRDFQRAAAGGRARGAALPDNQRLRRTIQRQLVLLRQRLLLPAPAGTSSPSPRHIVRAAAELRVHQQCAAVGRVLKSRRQQRCFDAP